MRFWKTPKGEYIDLDRIIYVKEEEGYKNFNNYRLYFTNFSDYIIVSKTKINMDIDKFIEHITNYKTKVEEVPNE